MRSVILPFGLALALLAQAAPALRAADLDFGGQLGVAAPTSAFRGSMTDGLGVGGGLHLLVEVNDLIACRTKAEFWNFQSISHGSASSPKFAMGIIGEDLVVSHNRKGFNDGLYSYFGLFYSTDTANVNNASFTKTSFGDNVGVGYQFDSQLGLELRYTSTSGGNYLPNSALKYISSLGLIATYRFNSHD